MGPGNRQKIGTRDQAPGTRNSNGRNRSRNAEHGRLGKVGKLGKRQGLGTRDLGIGNSDGNDGVRA